MGHGRGGVKYLSSSLFYCCFNPSVTSCHLPYILRCITQGRRVRVTLRLLQCDAPHTGHGREDCDTKDFLSLSKKVLVTLIRFICSFFSAARRMNPEGLPFFINPSVLRTPPLCFALQNTGEEGNTSFENEVGYRSFFFAVL